MLAIVSLHLWEFKWGQCQVSMRWSWDCLESLDEPSCPKPRICHHWCMEYDIAICFFRDGCPRWWPPPALTTARDVCPIQKRALGMPSARVKFLAPRRAKKQATFFKKGETWEKHSFLEVKNATMWIDVCQPSLGRGLGIIQEIHCKVIHVSTVYCAVCNLQPVYWSTWLTHDTGKDIESNFIFLLMIPHSPW